MRIVRVLAAAGLVALYLTLSAHAAPLYHLTDLGTLSGPTGFSQARAISPSGQVVGNSFNSSGLQHAFLWTQAGGMQDIGDLPGGG